MATGVADLVERRAVPIDRYEIGLWWRDLHEIMPRVVESPLATDAEIHARRPDQRLRLRQDEIGLDRRRHRHYLVRQALALSGIEDGEALQERDRLRFFAGFCRAPAFVIWGEPVSIDDGR